MDSLRYSPRPDEMPAFAQRCGKLLSMSTNEREARIRARLASVPEMTADQRHRQRESFAYGNVKIDEPSVTRPALTKP